MSISSTNDYKTSLSAATVFAGIVGLTGVVFVACLLGGANLVKPTGTDFCLPGQNGVPACPCNNSASGSGGCGNFGPGTIGQSAVLSALGVASVTDGFDTLQFQATNENNAALTVFLQSSGATSGNAYGAGVSCLAGPTLKLYSGNAGHGEPLGQITRPLVGNDLSVHERSAALGDAISSGQTRYYMAGYRDPKASQVSNCNDTNKTFNSTQGVAVVWGP